MKFPKEYENFQQPEKVEQRMDVEEQLQEEDLTNLASLRNLHRYYSDALQFCELIQQTIPICGEFIISSKKQESIEAMNYFVILHMFGIESAQVKVSFNN